MKNNNQRWFRPAMRLIEKYAPNTHEAMLNADWEVSVVQTGDDLLPIASKIDQHEMMMLVDGINHGLGMTITHTNETSPNTPYDGPPELWNTSWLNSPKIEAQAARTRTDPVRLAAQVIVHEWMHRRGYGEKEAYAAGAKFARQMGDERLARIQEETGRQIQRKAQDPLVELLTLLGLAA